MSQQPSSQLPANAQQNTGSATHSSTVFEQRCCCHHCQGGHTPQPNHSPCWQQAPQQESRSATHSSAALEQRCCRHHCHGGPTTQQTIVQNGSKRPSRRMELLHIPQSLLNSAAVATTARVAPRHNKPSSQDGSKRPSTRVDLLHIPQLVLETRLAPNRQQHQAAKSHATKPPCLRHCERPGAPEQKPKLSALETWTGGSAMHSPV